VAADPSPSVTPIRRRTAGQLVADEIRRRIWSGDLESGERLNQEDLAAALGVSRLPVREALLMLEREGVVQMAPHKGAFVERIDEPAVRDHYELFGHLDGFALRRTDREALVDGDVRLTFAELAARPTRPPGRSWRPGSRPGDRVAIWAPNAASGSSPRSACTRAGAVWCPSTPGSRAARPPTCSHRPGPGCSSPSPTSSTPTTSPCSTAEGRPTTLEEVVVLRGDAAPGTGVGRLPRRATAA
jgi:hypothetical protein